MAVFAFIFGNLASAIIGAVVLRLLDKNGRLSALELWCYGYLVGIGLIGFVSFLCAWGGIWISWLKYPIFVLAVLMVAIVYRKTWWKVFVPKYSPILSTARKTPLAFATFVLIGGLIAFRIFFSAFNTVAVPSYFDDEKWNWNIKAKEIFHDDRIVLEWTMQTPNYLGGGWHREYPLQFVLYKAYLTNVAWEWNEPLVNSVTLLFWIATLILVYQTFSSKVIGLVAVYALSSLPMVPWHAGRAYFDLMIAAYFLLCLISFRNFIKDGDGFWLILIGFLSYSAVFTKNEGAVLMMPALLAALASYMFIRFYKKTASLPIFWWKEFFLVTSSFAFILPHLAYRAIHHLSFNPHSAQSTYWFHADSLNLYWNYFTQWGSFNIFWYAIPVLFAITWKRWRKPENLPIAAAIVAMAGIMFVIFSFTNNYEFLVSQTTINRTLLIFMVPVTYFCVLFLDLSTSEKS